MNSSVLRSLLVATALVIAAPVQAAPADDNDRGASNISDNGAENRNYDFKDKDNNGNANGHDKYTEANEGASAPANVYPSPDLNFAAPALLALAGLLFLIRRRIRAA